MTVIDFLILIRVLLVLTQITAVVLIAMGIILIVERILEKKGKKK